MLFKIFKDAFIFFDRRWVQIATAAILSVGLAYLLNTILSKAVSFPSISIPNPEGEPVKISYLYFAEAGIFILANIWFKAFASFLVKAELKGLPTGFLSIAKGTTSVFPKVLIVNIVAGIIVFFSIFIALPMFAMSAFGILFFIPAIAFVVWFSLVSPVAVIDNISEIRKVLIRSRLLVHGKFWTILIAISTALIPPLTVVGIQTESMFYLPIEIFTNIATAIIGSLITVSAYVNLRIAKGEEVGGYFQKQIEESTGG